LLRENELLAAIRPKFNSIGVYPRAYRYFHFTESENTFEFRLTGELAEDGRIYGAFKTGCITVFGCAARLLWTLAHEPKELEEYPYALLGERPGKHCQINKAFLPAETWDALIDWASGEEDRFSQLADETIQRIQEGNKFLVQLLQNDVQQIRDFFERSARKNLELRTQFEIDRSYIEQEKLNELHLRSRGKTKERPEPSDSTPNSE
jgi:hypothetical protein